MTDARQLRDALDAATAGHSATSLSAAVERLITRYRTGGAASSPILAGSVEVAAYASYRMPSTYAACVRALDEAADVWPGAVSSVLDLGGGTGAAAWAALTVWPDASASVLEQVDAASVLGARLSADLPITFRSWRLGASVGAVADLVTVSYVLSELSSAQQDAIVDAALGAASGAVFVIEPGTPDGHARVMRARARLIAAGWQIVAPCPHQQRCPADWCHFAARVERSSMHRQLKSAELSYEDEKFAYVVAVPPGSEMRPPTARVIRHPLKRKGLVELELCTDRGELGREIVTKRRSAEYKQARDLRWGDPWDQTTP